MQITIVVDDRIVIVDGIAAHLPDLDWGHRSFVGDPGTLLDDVSAVQYDTVTGQGTVEYRTLVTRQATRPNVRPPDWYITPADFESNFAWVMPAYREAAARQKAEDEARQRDLASMSERPAPGDDVSALKAEVHALKEIVASHRGAFERINDVLPGEG